MFSLFKKKDFFSKEENDRIIAAIRDAEKCTSGEVRVFVESRCRFMDPMDRALEIFSELQMENTSDRNAVLLYVAIKDRQLAIYGDKGIHEKTGSDYWHQEVNKMVSEFSNKHYSEGIAHCVEDIGQALYSYFPFDRETDKNELPDDIIFGR